MELINDLLSQITNLSTGALLVSAVIIVGYVIRAIPQIPNAAIPIITLPVAIAGNYFLGDVGMISPTTRNPELRLAFLGMIYWGIGWLLHNQGLSRLEKFLPAPLKGLLGVEPEPPKPPAP